METMKNNTNRLKAIDYFRKISEIPRGSGNCGKIADYMESFAKSLGLSYIRDNADNLIIFKPAAKGRENDPAVMIQGHLDMVCEKRDGVVHDFSKEGVKLIETGDILSADGTTLGADDGIAVSLMMELLADGSLDAPALECVFTTDEEIGMLGAVAIDLSSCRAKYLINADSEEEGVFTCGCAGGLGLDFSIPVEKETVTGDFVKVSVSGLLGGHSGTEIDKGRQNGIKLLASLLSDEDRIVKIERDGKDNAIPARCDATVLGDGEKIRERFEAIDDFGCEKNVRLDISKIEDAAYSVLTADSQKRVLEFLHNVPYGIKKMCDEPKGLVHTSDNIGILNTEENKITGTLSVRSIEKESGDALTEELIKLINKCGGTTLIHGAYPGWNYKKDSVLRDTMVEVYERVYGKKVRIDVIHAGLECGVILSKMPSLDIVSIGCDIRDIHTPDECMSISSLEAMVKFAREVLRVLK